MDNIVADFLLYDCGSIIQLTPQTKSAKEWLQANVESEGWQWMGNGLCILDEEITAICAAVVTAIAAAAIAPAIGPS